MGMKKTLFFLSASRFGALVLRGLSLKGWDIVLITKKDKPQGRGLKPRPNPAKIQAQKVGIGIKEVENKDALIALLQKPVYDLALVAGFSFILPETSLVAPKTHLRALGLHPSLLPKYRGPAPIQFALWKGECKTGIVLFQLTKGMDEGPIIAQKEVVISPQDNYLTLEKKLASKGAELVIENLDLYVQGKMKPFPQRGKVSYTRFLKKEDGKIDLSSFDPKEVWNRFRAFASWPGIYLEIQGKKVRIVDLQLKKGRLLIKKVIPEGKKEMSFAEFLRGYSFPLDLRDKIVYP